MDPRGIIEGINGSVITVAFEGEIHQSEVAYASAEDLWLKAEVVRIRGHAADLQVFESTAGLRVGNEVRFSGERLSAELGPGLLGQVYDGLQNPLHRLANQCGFFLARGTYLPALDRERSWVFTPAVRPGAAVEAGDTLGTVPEGRFTHRIMVPFDLRGRSRVLEIAGARECRVDDRVALLQGADGSQRSVSLSFRWPVKQPIRFFAERLAPQEPLITQIRLIDSVFPVARGGTYCVPGPFGAGKTVLQQLTSKFAQVDVVIIAACGERAAEVVETLRDFPHLEDPAGGGALMDRTIIICNTSSMPVAARESSVYTAVTLAEYYRQMGLHVLLLADSTSRWAQAMRERSGRLEEIPGEEAFPAYLESVVAEFYERAGLLRLREGGTGSVTIGGTVSPAGGNFEEPVTQATLKVVGAFHALSRERSDARRYPAIDPLQSWSRYDGIIPRARRQWLRDSLARGHEVEQMMKVVGEEGTSLADYLLYLKAEFVDQVFLQQEAFDPVDCATPAARQARQFGLIERILTASLDLGSKQEARGFFHRLRRLFLDWNRTGWSSPEFERQEAAIDSCWQERAADLQSQPSGLLRSALLETELDSEARRARRMQGSSPQELAMDEDHEEDRD